MSTADRESLSVDIAEVRAPKILKKLFLKVVSLLGNQRILEWATNQSSI